MSSINKVQKNQRKYIDYSLIFVLLFLLAFGMVMVYSTSSYNSSLENNGNAFVYLRKQLISTVIGLVAMLVVSLIPYVYYIVLAPFAYIFSLITVFLVLTPLGHEANGASRWIYIGGYSIQVAEIVKIAVIMMTAFLVLYYRENEEMRNSLKYIFIVMAPGIIAGALVYKITNNLSSAIIIVGISYVMLLISNPRNIKLYILTVLGLILIAVAIVVLYQKSKTIDNASELSFRFERVFAWFDPEKYIDGKGYQPLQSLYSIGSGGMWGKGLGKSMQKLGFLPEASNDMIFSIICEELGLFGGFATILLYIILLYRLVDISSFTKNYFGAMLIAGVFSHIAIQVVLNIAVATNTIPNTGISLPFISYGGSSVIFLLIEMGIVMNIALEADFRVSKKRKKRPATDKSKDTAVNEEESRE